MSESRLAGLGWAGLGRPEQGRVRAGLGRAEAGLRGEGRGPGKGEKSEKMASYIKCII